MNRSIEQALSRVIPRHSGDFPPELIELASSLLAQSRTKASNLKAEEEIGRTFACANIACERLKTTLNLAKIEPRPPLAPKVYQKLYAYFDRTLASTTGPSRKRTRRASPSPPPRPLPQKYTPRKEASLAAYRTQRTPKKGLKYGSSGGADARIPKWISPVVRELCERLNTGNAVPHVLAGVESVICLPRPREYGEGEERVVGMWPAMVVAVWAFVVLKLRLGALAAEEIRKSREKALVILEEIREDDEILKRVGSEEEDWEGWDLVVEEYEAGKYVDKWIQELVEGGWNEMDWHENIKEQSGLDEGEEDVEVVQRPKKRTREDDMKYGLGTMRQAKVDYLSDEKREKYAEWKIMMLAKIDEMIANGVLDD